ncbi:hypothetical protein WA1_49665 [Scytonema hofmannii PCC 7110]|uniref:Uncharacterized protein n=1 Tax=Scytonema hofmannii PCC 7110 TaxID=128403 RepID=A0A139WQT5_9CYAN|nr:hypothetical protein [Scytonema hofmannii]KYC34805.1 hypothetical protein WA1_49665 [Scytonema hofmannii PCC 7110]
MKQVLVLEAEHEHCLLVFVGFTKNSECTIFNAELGMIPTSIPPITASITEPTPIGVTILLKAVENLPTKVL